MANFKTTYNGKPVEITQERYQQFLKDNPGDAARVGKAFADDDDNLAGTGGRESIATGVPSQPVRSEQPSAPMAGLSNAAPGGSGGAADLPFSPITGTTTTAGGGLSSSVPSIQGNMEPGPGFVESGVGAGALRALGQRRLPEQSMALAGLQRAY